MSQCSFLLFLLQALFVVFQFFFRSSSLLSVFACGLSLLFGWALLHASSSCSSSFPLVLFLLRNFRTRTREKLKRMSTAPEAPSGTCSPSEQVNRKTKLSSFEFFSASKKIFFSGPRFVSFESLSLSFFYFIFPTAPKEFLLFVSFCEALSWACEVAGDTWAKSALKKTSQARLPLPGLSVV